MATDGRRKSHGIHGNRGKMKLIARDKRRNSWLQMEDEICGYRRKTKIVATEVKMKFGNSNETSGNKFGQLIDASF